MIVVAVFFAVALIAWAVFTGRVVAKLKFTRARLKLARNALDLMKHEFCDRALVEVDSYPQDPKDAKMYNHLISNGKEPL